MALNASVIRSEIVHSRRVESIAECWVGDMLASRPVASFAADVPLGDLLCMDVVVHRVAAIAGWSCRPLHVVRRIKGGPPVRALVRHMIRKPRSFSDVPLNRQRIIIAANLCEIALFPDGAIHKSDLVFRELCYVVGAEIGNDGVWMFPWVAHHIGHRCFLPVLVDLRVALRACL